MKTVYFSCLLFGRMLIACEDVPVNTSKKVQETRSEIKEVINATKKNDYSKFEIQKDYTWKDSLIRGSARNELKE